MELIGKIKKHRIAFSLILFLIILIIMARLFLSYFVLNYIIRQVNRIPEYRVKIADLDMHLWRGSYTLQNIELWKVNAKLPVPFFRAEIIDFSIQWAAIFHGRFVAKVNVENPILNFVTDPNDRNEQLSIDDYWLTIVKSLFPLNINRLDVHKGIIYFRSYRGKPPFVISVKNIEFFIENMQKIKQKSVLLSSTFSFVGEPNGGGKMKVSGKYNPFNKQPTFDLKAAIGPLRISKISPLLKHYIDIKVVGGTFSLYGEAAAANGVIKGYAKPFLKNLKIADTDNNNPLEAIYEGLVAGVAKILEDSETKTIATKINLSGRIDDPDTSILSIIGYLLRHAFIQALIPQVDNSIKIQDVIYKKPPISKDFPLFRK
jgi:hypothetical protein